MKKKMGTCLVTFLICLSVLPMMSSMEASIESQGMESVGEEESSGYTYANARILIVGTADSARTISQAWRTALYIPIVRRTFDIDANGNNPDTSLTVTVIGSNQGGALFSGLEDMHITLTLARGVFFWAGRVSTGNTLAILCHSRSAYIHYETK